MPQLIFSQSDHLNTDISDEQGHQLYTISTPSTFHRVTTITKYIWSGSTGLPQTLGIIEWHSFTGDTIQFQGKVTDADVMLQKQSWQSGRYFVGPDNKSYKWKLSPHCWLKPAGVDRELVRFHERNHGIMKDYHDPYLDVSSEVVPMLDYIILTFVYVEKLRREEEIRRNHRRNSMHIDNINNFNDINNLNNIDRMSPIDG